MATRVNLELDAQEEKELVGPPDVKDGPKYPYGTCLTLDGDTIEKLGLDPLPKVGTQVRLDAIATVTSISSRQTFGGETRDCVELQVTDLALGDAGEDDEPKRAAKLYDGNKAEKAAGGGY